MRSMLTAITTIVTPMSSGQTPIACTTPSAMTSARSRGRRARSRHDLRQFDDLVHALDAILHRDLKDWMLYPQSCFSASTASNDDPLALGFLNSEYSAPLPPDRG